MNFSLNLSFIICFWSQLCSSLCVYSWVLHRFLWSIQSLLPCLYFRDRDKTLNGKWCTPILVPTHVFYISPLLMSWIGVAICLKCPCNYTKSPPEVNVFLNLNCIIVNQRSFVDDLMNVWWIWCRIFSARSYYSHNVWPSSPLSVWLQFPHRAQRSSSPPSQSNADLPELWGLRILS